MLPVAVRDTRVDNLHTKRAQIVAAQEELSQLPQASGMATKHLFVAGLYCRHMFIPAGTIIVGKEHKTDHFLIGCSGTLLVIGQGDDYYLQPGDVIPSSEGTKRLVMALTDVVALNIHRTDRQSTDGLEEELMARDPTALFDVNNQPKSEALLCG